MGLRWHFWGCQAIAYFSGQTELFDGINPKKVANNEQLVSLNNSSLANFILRTALAAVVDVVLHFVVIVVVVAILAVVVLATQVALCFASACLPMFAYE